MLTGLIRISFNKNGTANNDAREALTGTTEKGATEAPFQKKGTQMFMCRDAAEADVATALSDLAQVISTHAATLDFISISMMRQDGPQNVGGDDEDADEDEDDDGEDADEN